MEFKLLSVLKKFIPTEQYEALEDDFKKVEGELNTDINKYITSNTPDVKELEEQAKKSAHIEVIKALNIKDVETVEQLNKHMETVKLSSTEQAAEVVRLTTELGTVKTNYDTEVATRTKMETENTLSSQMTKIKGLVGEDQAEFIHFKLMKDVTEELPFDQVFDKYAEDNPPPRENKWVDPRFTKAPIVNPKSGEDGYAVYKELKAAGKL